MSKAKINIQVSYVDSPNSFWAQYDEEEYVDTLERIQHEVKGAATLARAHNFFAKSISELRIGCVYLAPYKDPLDVDTFYFRARLEKVYGDNVGCNVKVFFIDYGNTEMLRGDQLVPVDSRIKPTFRRIATAPAAAIECSLAETRPNPARNTRGIWDSEVLGLFKDLVTNKDQKLVAEVYSVIPQADSPLIAVKLKCASVDVGDWLKRNPLDIREAKYAAHSEEKYQSKYNHEARLRPSGFPENFLDVDRPKGLVGQDHFDWQPDPACNRILTEPLRGPLNPLEFHLTCAHRMGADREVRVEPDSVNHVLLDRYSECTGVLYFKMSFKEILGSFKNESFFG